ncbi:MAG: polyamine ABC transporter substrate-binding protein [Alphaproteobacteria bacterium]
MRLLTGVPLLGLAALFLMAVPAAAQDKVLNIYNWSDYIAEGTIAGFEQEYGIKVNYDVYDSNEILEGKLLAGKSGYDIVVPTASFLERQLAAGIFAKIDKSKLKNYGNLDPGIMARLREHDPDNAHAVPYMWGTTGFGFNVAKVAERLGADAATDTWSLIFDPAKAAKLADCGISMLDAPNEVFDIARNYLGLNPISTETADLDKAVALLSQVRPHIKYYHSSSYIDDLANGELCVAMGWSGDVFQAIDDAADGVEVRYVIPKEGAVIWFDVMAIPADAPHKDAAHLFIDYILRPDVVAKISDEVFYANPNAAATALVSDEVKGDPAIYPPPEVQARLFADKAPTGRFARSQTRAWTKVKTGQ